MGIRWEDIQELVDDDNKLKSYVRKTENKIQEEQAKIKAKNNIERINRATQLASEFDNFKTIYNNIKAKEESTNEQPKFIQTSIPKISQNVPTTIDKSAIKAPTIKITGIEQSNKDIKSLSRRKMAELSNYSVDRRNNLEKAIDNVTGVLGNVAMGLESVIPSATNYLNTGLENAVKLAGKNVAGKAGEVVAGLLYNNSDKINPIVNADKNLNSEEMEKWREETVQSNIARTTNPITNKLAELAPSIGANVLPMAVTAVNPLAGTALFMSSAAGNYLDEAKQRGMDDYQSYAYATIMGALEGGTESLISGGMVSKVKQIATGTPINSKILNSFGLNVRRKFCTRSYNRTIERNCRYYNWRKR